MSENDSTPSTSTNRETAPQRLQDFQQPTENYRAPDPLEFQPTTQDQIQHKAEDTEEAYSYINHDNIIRRWAIAICVLAFLSSSDGTGTLTEELGAELIQVVSTPIVVVLAIYVLWYAIRNLITGRLDSSTGTTIGLSVASILFYFFMSRT